MRIGLIKQALQIGNLHVCYHAQKSTVNVDENHKAAELLTTTNQ